MAPESYEGLPVAPAVELPVDPGKQPLTPALRRVVMLLCVNLGLSLVLTVLMFIFRDSVIDYQLAHMSLAPNADLDTVRGILRQAVWSRVISIVVVSLVYVFLVDRLRKGKRGAYRRVILISVIGLAGIGYLIIAGQYPVWMRVEQGLQAVVLAALLWSVTRPEVRARFAKPTK
ncbi:hypothetical protein F0L68_34740 [Solihabitans fulvus]|uniref:Uncharacterized protein n=1 Tax=Solihabitans fulvus TaxID=1892852 RepID=A0A5B2WRT9_9PSEU|nr:hypothetical protein [Solihabitans fulvus]KAA2252677.1 hypothetical protein F0L68_34740 [Solihabitans fulvus]